MKEEKVKVKQTVKFYNQNFFFFKNYLNLVRHWRPDHFFSYYQKNKHI